MISKKHNSCSSRASTRKQSPNHVEALKLLAYMVAASRDYQGAVKYLARALELDPFSSECWYYHGVALQHLDRHEKALASLNEASRLDPGFFQARHAAGLSLSALQRYQEAIGWLDRCVEFGSDPCNRRWHSALRSLAGLTS